MKISYKHLLLAIFFIVLSFVFNTSKADPPPPPPPGGHGSGGNQPPVGAPIDGGLGILIAMGAAYGGKKLYTAKKDKKKTEESSEDTLYEQENKLCQRVRRGDEQPGKPAGETS